MLVQVLFVLYEAPMWLPLPQRLLLPQAEAPHQMTDRLPLLAFLVQTKSHWERQVLLDLLDLPEGLMEQLEEFLSFVWPGMHPYVQTKRLCMFSSEYLRLLWLMAGLPMLAKGRMLQLFQVLRALQGGQLFE